MIVISWSETHSAETLDDLSLQPSWYLKVSEEQLTSGWWNSMITIIYPKLSWMMLMMMMMMMMINEWSASLSNHLSLTSMFFNTSPVFSPSQKISNRKSTMFSQPSSQLLPLGSAGRCCSARSSTCCGKCWARRRCSAAMWRRRRARPLGAWVGWIPKHARSLMSYPKIWSRKIYMKMIPFIDLYIPI